MPFAICSPKTKATYETLDKKLADCRREHFDYTQKLETLKAIPPEKFTTKNRETALATRQKKFESGQVVVKLLEDQLEFRQAVVVPELQAARTAAAEKREAALADVKKKHVSIGWIDDPSYAVLGCIPPGLLERHGYIRDLDNAVDDAATFIQSNERVCVQLSSDLESFRRELANDRAKMLAL